jgi:hypothetical protein
MVLLGRKTCEGKKRGGGGDPQSLSGATAWTVVGASSMRATRRSWVVCGAWDLGRMGGGTGPGTWAAVGERGPVALGRPKGIVSFANYSKIFK